MIAEPLTTVSRYVHRVAAPEYEAVADAAEQTLVRKLLRTALRAQIAVRACVHDPDSSRPHLLDCVALTERKLKPAPA